MTGSRTSRRSNGSLASSTHSARKGRLYDHISNAASNARPDRVPHARRRHGRRAQGLNADWNTYRAAITDALKEAGAGGYNVVAGQSGFRAGPGAVPRGSSRPGR